MGVGVSYKKLWNLLDNKNLNKIKLQKMADLSACCITKLRHNENVTTAVLNKICEALSCNVTDIMSINSVKEQKNKHDLHSLPAQEILSRNMPREMKYQAELFKSMPSEPLPETEFKFIDLFAGIGGIRLGFEAVGGQCVFSSEWDTDAAKTYEANFGEKPFGDITKISPAEIPDFDILLAGFPCQPFSIIGAKQGFMHETQGTLFFNIEEILKVKQPKAFMLENVRNLTSHAQGRTFKIIKEHLKKAGYFIHYKILNALDYGVPQKRERIIIVGFQKDIPFAFPSPIPRSQRKTIKEILEPDSEISPKLYVRAAIRDSRLARLKDVNFPKPYISHENVAGSITPHDFSCALRAGASANYLLINDERRPSEREMLRIQGFPDTFKIVGNYSKIKHQAGNSVAVPVIKAVAAQMIKAMQDAKEI